MITIGFSSEKIDPEHVEHIKKSCGIPEIEIIPVKTPASVPLSSSYNSILEKSTNDIVVFCRDDTFFETKNWGNKIVKHFKRNAEYGILGVVGSTIIPKSGKWMADELRMKGIINQEFVGKKKVVEYSKHRGSKIDPVVVVDDRFLAVHKDRIRDNFSDAMQGNSFHDVAFCYKNHMQGVKIGVIYDVRITSKTVGQFAAKWEKDREKFSEIYEKALPVKIVPELDSASPLKVMFCCPQFKNYTSTELYIYELVMGLKKLNCDVTVVSDIDGPLSKQAHKNGIKVLSLSQFPGFKLGDGRWAINTPSGPQASQPGMLYKIGNVDFDIIHTQHNELTQRVLQMYPLVPKVVTIHSKEEMEDGLARDVSVLKYVVRCGELESNILSMGNISQDQIAVVLDPISETKSNRKNTKDHGYILFSGSIEERHKSAILDSAQYAGSMGLEFWLVGNSSSGCLDDILAEDHVKFLPGAEGVEDYVKNCTATSAVGIDRNIIEGWACGKPGWVYTVDESGDITDKKKLVPPKDMTQYESKSVAAVLKAQYILSIKEWYESTEDIVQEKIEDSIVAKEDLVFNGEQLAPSANTNWGDLIPFRIIKELSKSSKLKQSDVFSISNPWVSYPIYSTGSVMRFTRKNSIVWGTGCIDKNVIGETPCRIYAVRGPLTRNELLARGIECPEVYGDPALLFPRIYSPTIEKKYRYGIIPHYIEYASKSDIKVIKNLQAQGVKVIDVCAGINEFVDQLLEVEHVIASSLHGLIAADAYSVPNARINISNKLTGGHFKFIDYFLSVGRETDYGLQLHEGTSLSEIETLNFNREITFDSQALLDSGPWNFEENQEIFF